MLAVMLASLPQLASRRASVYAHIIAPSTGLDKITVYIGTRWVDNSNNEFRIKNYSGLKITLSKNENTTAWQLQS